MTDTGWLPLLNAFLGFLATVFTGSMAYLMLRLKGQQDEAALKVREASSKVDKVAETLAASGSETARKVSEASIKVDDVAKNLAANSGEADRKLEEIRKMVDGSRSEMVAELKLSRADVLRLEKIISELQGRGQQKAAVLYTTEQVTDLLNQHSANAPVRASVHEDSKNVLVPRAKALPASRSRKA